MSTTRKVTEEIAQTLGSSMHMLLSVTTPRKVCLRSSAYAFKSFTVDIDVDVNLIICAKCRRPNLGLGIHLSMRV